MQVGVARVLVKLTCECELWGHGNGGWKATGEAGAGGYGAHLPCRQGRRGWGDQSWMRGLDRMWALGVSGKGGNSEG